MRTLGLILITVGLALAQDRRSFSRYIALPYARAGYLPRIEYTTKATPSVGYQTKEYQPRKQNSYFYTRGVAKVDAIRYGFDPLLSMPAEQLVDSIIAQTRKQTPKIVKAIRTLYKNNALRKLFDDAASDPCTVIPANLDLLVEKLAKASEESRNELILTIKAVQKMKANEDDMVAVIKAAAESLENLEPLANRFSPILKVNPECDSSLKAAEKQFEKIGNLMAGLSQSNIITRDPAGKDRLASIADTAIAISKVSGSLEEINFDSLCSSSPTFSSDIFTGVNKMMTALQEIMNAFNASPEDIQRIDEASKLVTDLVEILKEVSESFDSNLDESPRSVQQDTEECVTSIADVTKAITEVAEITDVLQ